MEVAEIKEEKWTNFLIEEIGYFLERDDKCNFISKKLYMQENINTMPNPIIVRDDNDIIVGCNLFINAHAIIQGREQNILWSHSTYLEKKFRTFVGLKFMMAIQERRNIFGFGLTQHNLYIQEKFGNWKFQPSYAYLLKILPQETILKFERDTINYADSIQIKNHMWCKTNSSDDLLYPNGGYWNTSFLEVDFNRNAKFMQQRFFSKKNRYAVYYLDGQRTIYFVTRVIQHPIGASLYLVDYRFPLNQFSHFSEIIEALVSIAVHNQIASIFIFSSIGIPNLSRYKLLSYGTPASILTNSPSLQNTKIFITPADSDCELWL